MFSGFGNVGVYKSFWLGLEALHQLTSGGGYTRMRVEMYANDSAWYSAEYDQFSVGNESTGYPLLNISGYSGDAGNMLWPSYGQSFSTFDSGGMQSSLAATMQGGWWYSGYDYACLNGAFEYSVTTPVTGFYWISNYDDYHPPPPPLSHFAGVKPGRLLISRIMIARP